MASGYLEAKTELEAVPCELVLARFYVEQYEFLARDLPAVRSTPATTGQEGRAS